MLSLQTPLQDLITLTSSKTCLFCAPVEETNDFNLSDMRDKVDTDSRVEKLSIFISAQETHGIERVVLIPRCKIRSVSLSP